MNYQKHYNTLMERSPKTKVSGVYLECHRIIPGCMGGEYVEGNIAYLTPEEHFVAHQLLVKIYPGNSKLIYAANTQGNTNNKKYGWLRRKFSENQMGDKNSSKRFDVRLKMSKSAKERLARGILPDNTGKNPWNKNRTGLQKHTDQWKKEQSLRHKGRKWYNNGIEERMLFTQETDWISGRLAAT